MIENKPKYSFIIPVWGPMIDNNLSHCLQALSIQTKKNFEVLVVGSKLLPFEDEMINGVRIRNIVIPENEINRSFGRLVNEGVKAMEGDYLHVWQFDNMCYQDYVKKLDFYVRAYGDDNLYTAKQIIMREGNEQHHDFFVVGATFPDGVICVHKKHWEPFFEKFVGYCNSGEEWLTRMWKKVTFVCLDILVVHQPHFPRSPQEQVLREVHASAILLDKVRRLGFDYSKYDQIR